MFFIVLAALQHAGFQNNGFKVLTLCFKGVWWCSHLYIEAKIKRRFQFVQRIQKGLSFFFLQLIGQGM